MTFPNDIRPSPIAGRWYPSDPRSLAETVDEYMDSAQLPEIGGNILAVIAPHAGHIYSGPVAGFAFAAVHGMEVDIVAVISPMHAPHNQPLLTTAHSAYATPLGEIPVDLDALHELDNLLVDQLGFGLTPIREDQEHSVEIELPFLQRSLKPGFRLLPVMIRQQTPRVAYAVGLCLSQVLSGRSALMVASTDLSHFYPQAIAESLDSEVLHQVEAMNPQGILEAEEHGKGFACGKGAVAAVLWASQQLGANQAQVLNYATSGDITGDRSQVVGYGAAVILHNELKRN